MSSAATNMLKTAKAMAMAMKKKYTQSHILSSIAKQK